MTLDPFLDATALAALVRTGEVSPVELVEAAIDRIESLNPELNAVITPLFDKARAAAGSPDLPDGPFRGVPMALKDLACHSGGDPFYEGFGFLKRMGWVEAEDTYLAARFRRAGFLFCGKTNTPESGILPTTEPVSFGPTRNPWNLAHSTGGSSGGSAAAVASGMVPVAHGNDGGGSIRIPASECGLVGLKPSRARVSLGPDFGDVMAGLVCEHVLTRTVRDSAAILDCIAGPEPGDPSAAPAPDRPFAQEVGRDPGRLRIGLLAEDPSGSATVDPVCATAVGATGRLLESSGHHVEQAHPDALSEPDFVPHFITLWAVGNAWTLDHWARRTGRTPTEEDVEPLTWALADMGRSFSGPVFLSALEWLQSWTRRVAGWWSGGFDLLLTPTIAEPPPTLGQFDSPPDNPLAGLFRAAALVPFTPAYNVTGQPAISLPMHSTEMGLPVGVQLVAPYGREDLLIRVASQLEEAAPWAGRLPPTHARAGRP